MIAPWLRKQPDEVQDVFAMARAALDGLECTGLLTPDIAAVLLEALQLREDLGV